MKESKIVDQFFDLVNIPFAQMIFYFNKHYRIHGTIGVAKHINFLRFIFLSYVREC